MELAVRPGPSLPELARTALARATAATVSAATVAGGPVAARPVSVRATRDGSLLLLPAAGSPLARWLAAGPHAVRVALPVSPPFSALRLTGTTRSAAGGGDAGTTTCVVTIGSVEFTGGRRARVPVEDYRAAQPDPFWRVAPRILDHLEQSHMDELVRCVRAHGMTGADSVIPRGLDRYGLRLLVLTADGTSAVRLRFPGGPVSTLDDVPMSLRSALTCHCQGGSGHGPAVGDDRR
jgi:hypothetical protein